MTPQDLAQIDELIKKRLDEQTDFFERRISEQIDILEKRISEQTIYLEKKIGESGSEVLEAVNVSTVSKDDFRGLEERVEKLENELRTA